MKISSHLDDFLSRFTLAIPEYAAAPCRRDTIFRVMRISFDEILPPPVPGLFFLLSRRMFASFRFRAIEFDRASAVAYYCGVLCNAGYRASVRTPIFYNAGGISVFGGFKGSATNLEGSLLLYPLLPAERPSFCSKISSYVCSVCICMNISYQHNKLL